MDLSFSSLDRVTELVAWPGDLAALMVGVAARQGASPTAVAQWRLGGEPLPADPFAPAHGAFNAAVAALMNEWKDP